MTRSKTKVLKDATGSDKSELSEVDEDLLREGDEMEIVVQPSPDGPPADADDIEKLKQAPPPPKTTEHLAVTAPQSPESTRTQQDAQTKVDKECPCWSLLPETEMMELMRLYYDAEKIRIWAAEHLSVVLKCPKHFKEFVNLFELRNCVADLSTVWTKIALWNC